jgi:hypothetical protein
MNHYGALRGLTRPKCLAIRETRSSVAAQLLGRLRNSTWRTRFPGKTPIRALSEECPLRVSEGHVARVVPYWKDVFRRSEGDPFDRVRQHLSCLVKYLDHVGDEEIVGTQYPTGFPW